MQVEVWRELDNQTEDEVWNRFESQFSFNSYSYSNAPIEWPGIIEPSPSVTYSITATFQTMSDPRLRVETDTEINRKALTAFRQCVAPGQKMYALDWQHPCYEFWPHAEFAFERRESWRVPVLPDGDYYIFLTEDFSSGMFGHPWQETMCVFGQPLVEAFDRDPPATFNVIRRK